MYGPLNWPSAILCAWTIIFLSPQQSPLYIFSSTKDLIIILFFLFQSHNYTVHHSLSFSSEKFIRHCDLVTLEGVIYIRYTLCLLFLLSCWSQGKLVLNIQTVKYAVFIEKDAGVQNTLEMLKGRANVSAVFVRWREATQEHSPFFNNVHTTWNSTECRTEMPRCIDTDKLWTEFCGSRHLCQIVQYMLGAKRTCWLKQY